MTNMKRQYVWAQWLLVCCEWSLPILLLFIFTQTGHTQAVGIPVATGGKAGSSTWNMSGTVVNSVTGEPVPRALVQAFGSSGGRGTLTDGAGHFEFDGLTENPLQVTATKPGFLPLPNGNLGATPVDRQSPAVLLKITPNAVITGRVTTRDEQPLEHFLVHALGKQIREGRAAWFDGPYQAQTDEEGNFRLTNLPAGTYYVAVEQNWQTTPGERGVANARERGYAKTFYPGVHDLSTATLLELSAGREVEANFVLTAEPIYQVSGNVNHANPGSLTFERKAGEVSDYMQGTMTEDGKFQVKLPAGTYTISGVGQQGYESSANTVEVTSDSSGVNVALTPVSPIDVELRFEHSGTASDRNFPEPGVAQVTMQLVSTSPYQPATYPWMIPPKNTPSMIPNVLPGVYQVVISVAVRAWWVKSAQCGGVDLLNNDLTIAEGTQPSPIELTLRDDGATVTGTITPAVTAGEATVLLVQEHENRHSVKTYQTGDGTFLFSNVAPGDYELLALDHGEQLEYGNPEVLNPYLSNAQHISVQPRGSANVTVNLTSTGR
jgi:hypothetical protein